MRINPIMPIVITSSLFLGLCLAFVLGRTDTPEDIHEPAIGVVKAFDEEVETTVEPIAKTSKIVDENALESNLEEVAEAIRQEEIAESYLGVFKTTAYCSCPLCCGEWSDGITYIGTTAVAGRTIAVDPNVIPLGTEVVINGRTYLAEDVGGAIKGNRIDVYMNSHSEALEYGVRYVDVYLGVD